MRFDQEPERGCERRRVGVLEQTTHLFQRDAHRRDVVAGECKLGLRDAQLNQAQPTQLEFCRKLGRSSDSSVGIGLVAERAVGEGGDARRFVQRTSIELQGLDPCRNTRIVMAERVIRAD